MKTVEQLFFEKFNIHADTSENAYFTGRYNLYPEITDTILLKLICIYNQNVRVEDVLSPMSYEYVKHNTLMWLIEDSHKGNIYKQVRKLFITSSRNK